MKKEINRVELLFLITSLFVAATPLFVQKNLILLTLIIPIAGIFWFYKRNIVAVISLLIIILLFFASLYNFPIFIVLLPLVYLALVTFSKKMRYYSQWFKKGNFSIFLFFFILLTVITTSVILILWNHFFNPDYSALLTIIPDYNPFSLVLIIVLWATLNAVLEEIVYRGIIWDGLASVGISSMAVCFTQAIHFGIMHLNGFPKGWIGVGLASVYGFLLGLIRHFSKGVFWPIVTHFFADITIGLIYLHLAGRL